MCYGMPTGTNCTTLIKELVKSPTNPRQEHGNQIHTPRSPRFSTHQIHEYIQGQQALALQRPLYKRVHIPARNHNNPHDHLFDKVILVVRERLFCSSCEVSFMPTVTKRTMLETKHHKVVDEQKWTLLHFKTSGVIERAEHSLLLHGHINLHLWRLQSNSLNKVKAWIPKSVNTSNKLVQPNHIA